jgi:hypothetical protein
MKADSIYSFQLSPTAKDAYLFMRKTGMDIPALLGVYVRTGKEYVLADTTIYQKQVGRQWQNSLYTKNKDAMKASGAKDKARISGYNLTPENPHRAFGDYGNDALLIEFSKDGKELTLYFFKDMKAAAKSLFEAWTAGTLPLTVEG